MFVNIIKSYRDVVAICDSELLGKRFEEGEFQLDVKENFYKGQEVEDEEASRILGQMAIEDATFNIVGKKAVELAIKLGVIKGEGVKKIQGVPFAMVFL